MSVIFSLFLIGISLSMDTFSLSLSIGTFDISKKKIMFFSLIVGIFHFFMPLIGNFFGDKIILFLNINVNFLLGLILLFIGIEMIIDLKKDEEKEFNLGIISLFLIAFSVSIDSFSTGLGLIAISNNFLLAGTIFSICAFLFTLIGLLIGKYSSQKIGIYANILGIILLIFLGLIHIFK